VSFGALRKKDRIKGKIGQEYYIVKGVGAIVGEGDTQYDKYVFFQ
jgi:hypothetical protein